MELFAEMGGLVERRWSAVSHDPARFPDIAADALATSCLAERVSPFDVIRWVHATPVLPRQYDLRPQFGNPPITVFDGSKFHIDVYYWLDGTTAVHQHAFSGAFQVLLGGSVHSEFSFEAEVEIDPQLRLGRLLPGAVSLLAKGDIRTIPEGSSFIHALFHLERPSATIVVRTHGASHSPVQFSYLTPGVAVDFSERGRDPWRTRVVQTVQLLLAMAHPECDEMVGQLLDTCDFHTAFLVLRLVARHLAPSPMAALFPSQASDDRFAALIERARSRHGEHIERLPAVFDEEMRQHDIFRRRDRITDPEHRFLMALLLNVRDRRALLELVAQRHPKEDPVTRVMGWLDALTRVRVFGSPEPNVLGVEKLGAVEKAVLEGLLRGVDVGEVGARLAGQGLLRGSDPHEAAVRLRAMPLFRAIL